jgi:hypothetical protein
MNNVEFRYSLEGIPIEPSTYIYDYIKDADT